MKKHIQLILISFLLLNYNLLSSQCLSKISSGYNHNVGIKPNGSIWGWGWGNWGQLNNGTSGNDEYVPITLSSATDWQYVVAGKFASFAIKNNGTLWACGGNTYGALGINSTAGNSYNLVQIGTATNWKQISANDNFTIGLKTDGTLWGTGQNDGYQMGNNTCCSNQLSFIQIGTATDWKTIATSGNRSSFAIKNNGTYGLGEVTLIMFWATVRFLHGQFQHNMALIMIGIRLLYFITF